MKKSLFEELTEDLGQDKKIVTTFKAKSTLSPKVFEKTKEGYVLKKEVRKRLIEIANNFTDFLGIEFFIHDVVLTGSLANYNWSEYSDVDLHIVIDFKETEYDLTLIKEFFDAKKQVWNNQHSIEIMGYDVEIYVQDLEEEHVSSGVYSILHNEWVVEPEPTKPNIDDKKILAKGETYAKAIDKLVSDCEKGKDVSKQVTQLRDKIKKFRQSGLAKGGEFSYENLTFKLLRRNGYFEKLLNLKGQVADKKLSMGQ